MLDTINKDDSNSPKDWNGFVPFSSIVDSIPTALELSTRLSNILGINLRHEDSSIETKDTQNKVLLQSMSDNNLLINSDLSTSARVTLDDEKWTGLVDAIEVLFTSFVVRNCIENTFDCCSINMTIFLSMFREVK